MLSTEYSLLQLRKGQPGGEEDALDFEISDTTGAFSLGRHARDLTLTSEQGVILGTRGEHLTLGPNVVVAAAEIVVDAETASIDATGRPAEVVLAAGSITAKSSANTVLPESECSARTLTRRSTATATLPSGAEGWSSSRGIQPLRRPAVHPDEFR